MEIDVRNDQTSSVTAIRFDDNLVLIKDEENPKYLMIKNTVNGRANRLIKVSDVDSLRKALAAAMKVWGE
jgi:hypothetical protein